MLRTFSEGISTGNTEQDCLSSYSNITSKPNEVKKAIQFIKDLSAGKYKEKGTPQRLAQGFIRAGKVLEEWFVRQEPLSRTLQEELNALGKLSLPEEIITATGKISAAKIPTKISKKQIETVVKQVVGKSKKETTEKLVKTLIKDLEGIKKLQIDPTTIKGYSKLRKLLLKKLTPLVGIIVAVDLVRRLQKTLAKKTPKKFVETIPQGEYYHSKVGWY